MSKVVVRILRSCFRDPPGNFKRSSYLHKQFLDHKGHVLATFAIVQQIPEIERFFILALRNEAHQYYKYPADKWIDGDRVSNFCSADKSLGSKVFLVEILRIKRTPRPSGGQWHLVRGHSKITSHFVGPDCVVPFGQIGVSGDIKFGHLRICNFNSLRVIFPSEVGRGA